LVLFTGLFGVETSRAAVELAPPFADHAVLQRDRAIPIWGTATPAEKITVQFHGASVHTVAGPDHRWTVTLAPLAADSNGAELVVTGENTLTLHDVVVGDVWLCAGQSNMGRKVSQALNPDIEIPGAHFPLIRMLSVRDTLADAPADHVVTTGWRQAVPENVRRFSAVGYFYARALHQRLGVPIGIIHSSFGGTRIEAWMSPSAMAGNPAFAAVQEEWKKDNVIPYAERKIQFDARIAAWRTGDSASKAAGDAEHAAYLKAHPKPSAPMTPQQGPSVLFNGMIAPLLPYGLRGIVWYQGESNVWTPATYRLLFSTLITSWRAHFGQPELPFYLVQLADLETGTNWAWVREAQTQALSLPHTGQAVTIDIGDPGDIHPRNKQEVARRLMLIAGAQLYGDTAEFSGPVLALAERAGAAMTVHFKHATGGLVVKGAAVNSLELAGADRVFHPAIARVEGEALVVSSPDVKEAVAVRYAWCSEPHANLYNAAGLPAGPFRTDPW
jgi:sialate O-acetylesterase